ncbi:MAG TPA: PHP domain-containing protein, partial [Gemmatimonadales bacterium]|nr:PHP domain-containing protein [Gemmatimonadales bacterium]
MFVPLHTKSEYSLGLGTAPVEALLRRAADFGYPALALTDLENLSGQVRLHHAAYAAGIQPITGVELRRGYGPSSPGDKAGRLVLLARDREGYQSLCRIITRRRDDPDAPTAEPLSCLEANPRGIFFLSDDPAVPIRLLRAGVNAREIRFLVASGAPIRQSASLAKLGLRVVAAVDAILLDAADHPLHLLLAAIRQHRVVSQGVDSESAEAVLPSPQELARRFGRLPGALAETLRLAEACTLDLREAPVVFPSLPLPGGESPDAVLAHNCRTRLGDADPTYRERLEHELEILRELGFAGYFLVVAEIAAYARQRGIALAGRGSAASSLVAFLLGLSTVDPLRHGLFFERFVHPARRDLPDIDLDLPSDRRDEVIDWVFRRFGAGRVAMVAAHQTFGRRAAYREGLKAFGMSLIEVKRFCEQIPEELEPGVVVMPPLPPEYRAAAPLLERLIGRPQHLSVHPGGLVLAEPAIECYAPLERAPKGVPVTQYDMTSLEKLGLIKLDLLGTRALSALEEARR